MFACDAHKTGAMNEMKAQLYYIEKGYDVFIPTHGKTRADFVAVKGQEIIRVQVKTAQYNNGYIQSRLEVSSKKYKKEECDVIFLILEEKMWIVPVEVVEHLTTVNLGKINSNDYKPYKGYNPNEWRVQ